MSVYLVLLYCIILLLLYFIVGDIGLGLSLDIRTELGHGPSCGG